MRKFSAFNPYVEDVLLWAGPEVRGSFSFLNPLGRPVTLFRRYDGEWKFIDTAYYLVLGMLWGWYE